MRPNLYAQLYAIARRTLRDAGHAEDCVQEALLAAVLAGRIDFDEPETGRWLSGAVRNKARMAARASRRRQSRETVWQAGNSSHQSADAILTDLLAGLPPALRTFAALVLSGHNRREIAYLLNLPDTALRQRVSALKRHMKAKGLAAPDELTGLNLDLAYGRIRDCLLPALHRHGGVFASHDPDGHLFVVRRSQTVPPRQ